MFNLEYIVNCKKISVEQKCYYIRFYNNGSTIYKQYNDFYWDNIKIINLFVDFVNNSSLYKKAIDELYKHYAVVSIDRICTGIDKQSRLKDIENIEEILKDIHNREIKMSNAKGIKNKILYLLMNDKQSILIYFIFSYIRNKYLYLKNKKW